MIVGVMVDASLAPVISATPLLTDNAIDVTGTPPLLFHYTSTASATPPSLATIKAAPDGRALSTGANSITGLTQETTPGTWYFHYVVSNAAGDSAIQTESYVVASADVELVATGASATSSSTSMNVALPTNIADDLLVMVVSHYDTNNVPTTPAGWTLSGDGNNTVTGYPEFSVFTKVSSGSESSPVALTFSASGSGHAGACFSFRNAVVGSFANATSNATTTAATPTLTALADSTILHIWLAEKTAPITLTFPNPGDVVLNMLATASEDRTGVEMQQLVGAGVTTARTATANAASYWNMGQLELRKA